MRRFFLLWFSCFLYWRGAPPFASVFNTMPYLLLILGLIIGGYALYRFFLNAEVAQIKAAFILAILVVLCASLFTMAVIGRLPQALGLLVAVAPLAAGLWKARRDEHAETLEPGLHDEVRTREEALEVLGLENGASEKEIKAAYKRLMQKVHPDHEGSEWMAAKLNQARDILLKTPDA
ncbi:MAG: DnaJ domain-containing protein [Rhodospirillales bacterium]|nr:DnaJ domain-containing protein [Rhodospirillales bacterium]